MEPQEGGQADARRRVPGCRGMEQGTREARRVRALAASWSRRMSMNVSVFGLGHVGSVTAACLARAGHRVVGVDVRQDVVDLISSGHAPVPEPGLAELLAEAEDADPHGFSCACVPRRYRPVVATVFSS